MATYKRIPATVPSSERTTLITDVAAGDTIDIQEILGRSARGLQFIMPADTDVVEYRLNSLLRTKRVNPSNTTTDYVWSTADAFPVFSSTGATVLETVSGLEVSSVQVVGLTLGAGTTIQIVVW
jgi:hypothetical protein